MGLPKGASSEESLRLVWVDGSMMNNVAGRDKGGQTGGREGGERVGSGRGGDVVGEMGGG